MKKNIIAMGLSTVLSISIFSTAQASVKAWEDALEIPTYLLAAPEKSPIFDCDWSYQRARRSVYPYCLNDNMTRVKKTVSYKAVYLENEYVKLCVLPEIGGRLFYAVDKTNGYEIFYHQDVIKPANVGMLGAWISGGVEWNVFHHHRATTNDPIDYKIVENADGSKTIWLGETELRHRMSWAIGVTLRPEKSYIEISGRLVNSTKNSNSMLYWTNAATHANENYQIIFPQNTEFGVFHCKSSFCHWPITREAYVGVEEYKRSIDASWWKNHPVGNSIFVHELKDDFVGGYDHGKKAGTVMSGNHYINAGGKFWSWGPNSGWPTKILTDTAGHYVELMAGAYSDNQPDYNWSYPNEMKSFTQYWYGIRDIGGVKKSSKNAAMNIDMPECGKVFVGVNVTEKFKDLSVEISHNGKILFVEKFSASPDKPYLKTVSIDENIALDDLTMTLKSSNSQKMLSYTPVKKDIAKPLPKIVDRPLLPAEIANNEECYLVGLRNLQFNNPFIKPTDYFNEVLRRDAGDSRSNTQMGVYWRLRGDNVAAEKFLRRAIARLSKDYTRPKDCEAIYNLGLILKEEGRTQEAAEMLYRATWNYPFASAANFQLAQIYSCAGDYELALERLDAALMYNATNILALNLKSSILRALGRDAESKKCSDKVLEIVPVNEYAAYEKSLAGSDKEFARLMHENIESYIELAISFLHNGFKEDAKKILKYADAMREYPTVKMWLGYIAEIEGDKSSAEKFYAEALKLPVEYCNPFRLETAKILDIMRERFGDNYKVHYYIGNLYYDKQPQKAIDSWTKCTSLNPSFALAWRNIGWANWKWQKNYDNAAQAYRKAIKADATQAIFFEEIDQIYDAKNESVAVRYKLLKDNHQVCEKRYYPLAKEAECGIFAGDFNYVAKLLKDCYFPTREGVANFHDVYVSAMLLGGKHKTENGDIQGGIDMMKESFKFPENHQVFLYDTCIPRDAQIYFMIAQAYEKLGDKVQADMNYKNAANVNVKKTDYRYWKAKALEKLGRKDEANAMFETLVFDGRNAVVDRIVNFYGAEGVSGLTVEGINASAYYTWGLGEIGLGHESEGKILLGKSLKMKADHLWAREMMNNLK